MLRWRLILGVLIIALLTGLCWLDFHAAKPGTWLFPLALLATALGAGEMVRLTSTREPRADAAVIYVGSLLPVAMCGIPMFVLATPEASRLGWLGWPLMGLAFAALLAFLAEMRRYAVPGASIERLGKSLLSVTYLGLFFSVIVLLRVWGSGPIGLLALVSMIAAVKASDIGAYTVGRLIGRHKLAPTLSPGKTWEGAAGGVAFALLASYLVFFQLVPAVGMTPAADAPAWGWIGFGVVMSVSGMIGDLAESLLKRDAGVKDSSTWMPGFGGVLDLVDSLLTSAPLAYLLWSLGWVGVAG